MYNRHGEERGEMSVGESWWANVSGQMSVGKCQWTNVGETVRGVHCTGEGEQERRAVEMAGDEEERVEARVEQRHHQEQQQWPVSPGLPWDERSG